jgi:hypothetical protein
MSTVADLVARELAAPVPPPVSACAAALRTRFGESVTAVLAYGSALDAARSEAPLDFYVLVNALAPALTSPLARFGVRILPPNVYRVVVPTADGPVACKVAILTMAAFEKGMRAFAPHLWARFAQPVRAVHLRNADAHAIVCRALAQAAHTAAAAALPLMPPRFTAAELWTTTFALTYAAELRPEGAGRAAAIVARDEGRYRALTAALLGEPAADGRFARPAGRPRPIALAQWTLRRPWGKTLNALRLMKAAFTFDGGLDYAVAKIARHSGVTVAVRAADRRVPLLGGIRIFLEARRRGGVR